MMKGKETFFFKCVCCVLGIVLGFLTDAILCHSQNDSGGKILAIFFFNCGKIYIT